jgi:hypothetical protein
MFCTFDSRGLAHDADGGDNSANFFLFTLWVRQGEGGLMLRRGLKRRKIRLFLGSEGGGGGSKQRPLKTIDKDKKGLTVKIPIWSGCAAMSQLPHQSLIRA